MLASAGDLHDFQYMDNEYRALPREVVSVIEDIRDFRKENDEDVKLVGNYYIGKKELGEGMFAKVKKGIHAVTGELVAIKITDKRKGFNDYLVKNLHREAKLLKGLRHPNIVQVYEVIETDSKYYLVMELCSGGDLMRYVERGGRLSEKEARKYMKQLVSAIDYLHQASILHRDFKLENILFDSEKNLKLIDFGLSNNFGGETVCGSPAYSSPEVLGAKHYGPQADIWSLGVNMFAMLTATLPYSVNSGANNVVTLLHAKMLERKMNPIPDDLSPECKDLLMRLLEFDPAKRIRMDEIRVHPWICENQVTPLSRCVFPNHLKDEDLLNDILIHMSKYMPDACTSSMSQLIMSLLNQELSADSAIYFLLEKRLLRYEEKRSKELISVNRSRRKSFSETDITSVVDKIDNPPREPKNRTSSMSKKTKSLKNLNVPKNMKRFQSERTLPQACLPDKQRSRHSTEPDDISMHNKLGLPMLSVNNKIYTEKQELTSPENPAHLPLPSMHTRPSTKACNRESKKNGLLEWVNRPMTNAASNRIKKHRSFKAIRPISDPESHVHLLHVFHTMERPPSLENLSVITDATFNVLDSPSMLSIHSVESDGLDLSRPHGAGHLAASPPFVPSASPSTLHYLPHHFHRTQTLPSRPPSTIAGQHLPSITPKVDKQSRTKKWHSDRIRKRPVV